MSAMEDEPELYDEILDAVEDRHGLPHAENAEHFEEHAAALEPGTPGRAAWWGHAGEAWELAGDMDRARRCYEQAVADGGGAVLDPRGQLLGVLLELGEAARAEDLLDTLRRAVHDGDVRGVLHELVGEALEMHGRPEEALRWFDAGLTRSERDHPGDPDVGCLNGHYRVRRTLGLPLDRYDELCEEHRRELRAEADDEESELLHAPGGAAPMRLTVLYWPPDDFARLLERWPEVAEAYGEDHDEHRRLVERHVRQLAERRPGLSVGAGSLDEYLAFAAGRGEHVMDSSTRASYAAHLGRLGIRLTDWPPGRNAPCWCGSGRKYKKCCGALRFTGD